MCIKYSIVIPLKNEEGNIADLVGELKPIMEKLAEPWELICIDDGSTDNTLSLLKEIATMTPEMRILCFQRNYGQSSAFDAGFRSARGEFVITLDGDRQNDPADIPKLLGLIPESDLVCGFRQKRNDPWHKKITSRIANAIRSRVCRDGVRDTGCSLKIYRTSCFKHIKMYQGMHRFLPALFQIEGFRVREVAVNHRERTKGMTKYNFWNRSFNTVTDMWAVWWMRSRQLKYQIHPPCPHD